MGGFRSKEDDVVKISLSVYITNFPDSCSAKDLFHQCKQYGHVVNSFIPNKKSKSGKQFGFVRFINVFNEERLVNNLCTVWIGRYKLQANLARFKRTLVNVDKTQSKNEGSNMGSSNLLKKQVDVDKGVNVPNSSSNSYVQVVSGAKHSRGHGNSELKVKEFASLANLKVAFANGCDSAGISKITYMACICVGSWFSCIKQAVLDFVVDGRIAWVEIEGVPFKLWSNNTFKRIANRWGELLDIDDQEEACYHSKRLCIYMKSGRSILENFKIIHRGKVFWIRASETPGWVPDFADEPDDEDQEDDMSKDGSFHNHVSGCGGGDSDQGEVPETLFENDGIEKNVEVDDGTEEQDIQSADPFNIYPLLDKKNNLEPKDNKSDASLKFPPGFTPLVRSDMDVKHEVGDSIGNMKDGKLHSDVAVTDGISGKQNIRNVKEDSANSVVSGHFKKSKIPRTGGSILSMLDEMVKVGQVMGYNMEGCQSNMAEIIRSQGVEEETKMENMNLLCVRMCWGNLDFDYGSERFSVGNSGGILCVWDPNSFCKHSVTCSDYFVMVRGSFWRSTGQLVLLIAVYAPQEVSLGPPSNAHAASIFINFIRSSGLAEINLGESFLNKCPNVNAITLERFLSDHRPILLRESNVDYGPTPFRFYHHWIEMEGFCKMVEDGWKDSKCDNSNAMRNLVDKLKYLKKVIRLWNKSNALRDSRTKLISDLEVVDTRIDKGYGTVEDIKSRVELLCKIQDIDKLKSIEMAQKIKVKWAVEGDENSSFFHGILNKKRIIRNIRGVMVNGVWVENPEKVKREFYVYFSKRFCCPDPRYVRLQMSFPNMLSNEQQRDLECEVSNAEIKKAVWDCGTDKAPGPDGFSFGFYRRFWYLIEKDVCDAVRYFFINGEFSNGCNSSFIALIPKIPDANMVKDFRPISLVGSLYKIISKILANRLVGVLSDIVSDVQSAFIAERQILDGPFILNEVLQWLVL
ncbi:RNA-directed DNA polymerase, eukaryota [Tanacetum coccineum]